MTHGHDPLRNHPVQHEGIFQYAPALVEDLRSKPEQLVPCAEPGRHPETREEDNGFPYLRASLMRPSDTIPFKGSRLSPSSWRQITFIKNDNRPRNRECLVMLVGERG